MSTKHFNLLEKRLRKLRRYFLPTKLSPTGNYKQSTYERVRGYKLLAHAEFEYYFEQAALEIATHHCGEWHCNKTVTKVLLGLTVYYEGNFSPMPDSKTCDNAKEGLPEKIDCAHKFFMTFVRSRNHGIKEKNILKLFLPLGLQCDDLEDDLLRELNNFGTTRGEIAHSTRAQQLQSPNDVLSEVDNLLSLVKNFDNTIKSLCA